MRFLADMGVSLRVVAALRADSHDVVHLRDLGFERLPDADVFLLAGRESRIVLTFDLDFGEIVAASGGNVVSVVLFRLHDSRPAQVIDRLRHVLPQAAVVLAQGALVVVEDGRHRIRRLPIGS